MPRPASPPVVKDVILGDHLTAYVRVIRTRPCHVVVLATHRIGLWLDNSDQAPAATADAILAAI
jgi:hypothetical protein